MSTVAVAQLKRAWHGIGDGSVAVVADRLVDETGDGICIKE